MLAKFVAPLIDTYVSDTDVEAKYIIIIIITAHYIVLI